MENLKIRELEQKDLFNGFLESLNSLRNVSDIDKDKAEKIFSIIKSGQNQKIFVAILEDKVVASTTLIIEQKFIHDGGLVGHIEDVVVSKKYQGKGIGKELIIQVLDYAKKNNCYKTILDCSDDVKSFYERIGFKRHSNCMRFDHK